MRHLLGQQAECDRAGKVEPECDEEPTREQVTERRVALEDESDGYEQPEQAQRAAGREDVPVLHAAR